MPKKAWHAFYRYILNLHMFLGPTHAVAICLIGLIDEFSCLVKLIKPIMVDLTNLTISGEN